MAEASINAHLTFEENAWDKHELYENAFLEEESSAQLASSEEV